MIKMHIPGVNIEVSELDARFYERAGYVRDEAPIEVPQPPEVPAEEEVFDPAEDPEIVGEVEVEATIKSKKSKAV